MLDRLGRPPSAPVIIPAGHRLSTATEQGRHRDGPVASRPEALMISALALSPRLDEDFILSSNYESQFLICQNRKTADRI
jgi:hypothetical protein